MRLVGAHGCAPSTLRTMPYNPQKHHRCSIRLKGYDYSQAGAYFITICTHERQFLFGRIVDGEMRLNDSGLFASAEWEQTPEIRKEIELDEWVVMPNHVHGIIVIVETDGTHRGVHHRDEKGAQGLAPLHRKPRSLSSFVAGYKSSVTTRINELRGTIGAIIWQRGFYEHIIRDEQELERIRSYIINNPSQWQIDELNPQLGATA